MGNYVLSEALAGSQLKIVNDGEFDVLALSNSEIDGKALSFAEDPKYFDEIRDNANISCLITSAEYLKFFTGKNYGIAVSENPRLDFFRLHNRLADDKNYNPESRPSSVGKNCSISSLAYIAPNDVIIGDNVTIEEFVSIRGRCTIGSNSVIRAGCRIGGGGYEFKKNGESFYNVEHCGQAVIGQNVIIWPNTTIHKAVFPWDSTLVGDNSNIASQVHIDHGAKIGKRCEICPHVLVAGRCKVGDYSFLGPSAVLSNRIEIGEYARVSLGAVVTKDVPSHETVTGNFAIDHSRYMEFLKTIR
ncbi:MAG: UDP-3-O-(3-hydroxymyristoyl)glucosamine N-acyltransferase [Candidatus Limivicinus sp.]|jgi:UDP-3-O-[3-hydroxymyristoyl] glucosamine N-acyltransferase